MSLRPFRFVGNKALIYLLLVFSLILIGPLLLSACAQAKQESAQTLQQQQATPTAFPPATATPLMPEAPFPPLVLATNPDEGGELAPETPFEIRFDQAMDRDSVEAAFRLAPASAPQDQAVIGQFDWVDDAAVQFTPTQPLDRGERYEVVLDTSAASAAGLPLNRPLEVAFDTLGFLEVANVEPADGAVDVAADTIITLSFNRPVVPLGEINTQADLPQPLSFEPAVEGTGRWLNTSIYQFTPDEGFTPSTEYTGQIDATLTALDGSSLADDFTWTFATVPPVVVYTDPADNTIFVSPTPVISLAFNQLMNHDSVEANFSLTQAGQVVPGSFTWRNVGLEQPPDPNVYYDPVYNPAPPPVILGVETLVFSPDEPLAFDTDYTVTIGVEAKSRIGAESSLAGPYSFGFHTVPELKVVTSSPADGETNVLSYGGLDVTFSAPLNPASFVLEETVSIEPPVSYTLVYSYFWENDTHFSINLPTSQFSTTYTVTLASAIESRYGQPLGEDVQISWTTAPRQPFIYLNAPEYPFVGTYTTFTDTVAYVTVSAIQAVDFALYHLPEDEFMGLLGQNEWDYRQSYRPDRDNLIREWQLETPVPANKGFVYGTNLSGEVGGHLEPGLYYLQISADPDNVDAAAGNLAPIEPVKQVIVVSDYNLTFKSGPDDSFAWLTALDTTQPVEGAEVRFLTEKADLGQATTDEQGVALAEHDRVYDLWPTRFAISTDPFAVATSRWDSGIARWSFQNISGEDTLFQHNGFLYTDRPIYRPGDTIYFKGILRQDDDAHYTLPSTDVPMTVSVRDWEGTEIYREVLPLNQNGTFNDQFTLDEEAPLGYYYISADYPQPELEQFGFIYSFGRDFQVAEYKPPEFTVEVGTDRPVYLNNDTIVMTATAGYFFGGPVANAPVQYNILAADSFFAYQGEGSYSFTDYENSYTQYDSFFTAFGQLIDQGTGQTNARGEFRVRVSADIADKLASQDFTLEAVVTEPDSNQVVAERSSAIVHKGEYYIGLRPQQYVGVAGAENGVDLITVDWDSRPFPRQEVTVVVAEHNWYSVLSQNPDTGEYFWESIVENTPIMTETVTTDFEGKAEISFVPAKGGIYKVTGQGTDTFGNAIQSAAYLWVSGDDYVNWRQSNTDRIDLIADKTEYEIGDTAKILIAHPYSTTVTALVTQERNHVYDYQVRPLETNSEQIEIPITADMLPNMFVSVVIMGAPNTATITDTGISPDSGLEINPLPSFKVGYAALNINNTLKVINLSLTPNDDVFEPGGEVTFDVEALDSEGNPVQAELSLALVDKAVLSLVANAQPSPYDQFWRRRGLGIGTATTLTMSGERINVEVSPLAKGGGGGDGFADLTLRTDFQDTAFWLADLVTDADGRGQVTISLPDNLTTWVLTARGLSNDDRALVADEQVEIVATKPLLVRPVVPRFLTAGDETEVKMIVQNNTGTDLDLTTLFEAEGVEVVEAEGAEPSSELSLAAGERATLAYPIRVVAESSVLSETAVFRFGATADEYQDAVEVSLPIQAASAAETVATAGVLSEDGRRLEGIALPTSLDPTQGELTISLDPSLAAGLRDSLDYLEHFPYECTEQTVSRFLPNIVTYRAYLQLGLDNPGLQQQLPELVRDGLQRLYNQQHLDGGWGWFSRDESNPTLTAYVVQGLLEAQKANFAVDESVLERGLDFLKQSLSRSRDVANNWQANERAYILYVLAEGGEGDTSRTVALFDQREQLDYFGRAFLALAMALIDDADPRVDTLINDLTDGAISSATGAHWEERQRDFWAMNTNTRSTAIIIATLSRLRPDHPLLPNAVRWLMTNRDADHWQTTQETAWSIIGLTDWMVVSGELAGNYAWAVDLNGQRLGEANVEPDTIDQTTTLRVEVNDLLSDEINRMIITRGPQGNAAESIGQLYYTTHLRYFKPAGEVEALDNGIVVVRQYTLTDDESDEPETITAANVGDIINVKLTIIAPNDLYYLLVEDPIPAGTEGVDVSLNTTSVIGQPPALESIDRRQGWGWWWFSHSELRDEKAVLFATYLPKGTYEYTYQIRASLAGTYNVIPAHAEEMYFPENFGRSAGAVFTVQEP